MTVTRVFRIALSKRTLRVMSEPDLVLMCSLFLINLRSVKYSPCCGHAISLVDLLDFVFGVFILSWPFKRRAPMPRVSLGRIQFWISHFGQLRLESGVPSAVW